MSTNSPTRHAGRRLFISLVLAVFVLMPTLADANSTQEQTAQLEKLQAKIEQLNKHVSKEVARKQSLSAKLGKLEQRIGSLHHALEALVRRKRELERRREKLDKAVRSSRREAQAARKALSRALRASFVLGREPRLKLALEGKDPSKIARTLTYYGYYSRANAEHVDELAATIAHYNKVRTKLETTEKELSRNVDKHKKTLASLKTSKQQRQAVVEKLEQDISGKKTRLAQLEQDAERLEKVVQSVHHDLEEVPVGKLSQVDFSQLRGKLPWPIAGKIVDHYGSSRADGNALRWKAIRIAAAAGTKVHAIAYGRVAYAGWLPFYGLVLMVDHGNGYLAVYGHNEALYKQVGQWVQPGDVITTVGRSGGQPRPMLYFQIRHGEQPMNPARWCRGNHPAR